MRLKLSVLVGCPPEPQHNPEAAADRGELGDTLVESASLAWLINPAVFPLLNPQGSVECFIEKRLFSLFDAGDGLARSQSPGQLDELAACGRRLTRQMGYGAAAAGVYDLDRAFFTTVLWACHRDVVGLMKFLACAQDPVQTRLLSRLSPCGSLLDAPSAAAVKRACATDSECGVVLGRVAAVFERCERFDADTARMALSRGGVTLECAEARLEARMPSVPNLPEFV